MPILLEQVLTFSGALFVGVMIALASLLLMQTIVAFVGRTRDREALASASPRPRVAVLVPAHNEAQGIVATLASLIPQLRAVDRLIVIADNCTDETARIAAAAGVEVIERSDLVQRGKGYALDRGIRSLQADPPDVVLMFDADCIAGAGCIAALADQAERYRQPIQALYIIRAAHAGVLTRLSEFAYRLRNWVRPLGMLRFDLPCQLMGSGMAFHWSLIEQVSLASGHLTEDLQLGLTFARLRMYPRFCPEATVDSRFVADAASATVQRTRWEHGHMGTIVSEWPSLAATAVARLDVRLACMAWDLAVPPLALFASLLIASGLVAVAIGLFAAVWWPAICIGSVMLMLLATIVLAQRGFARDLITQREIFLAVPLYVVRKAPVYVRFLFRRQVEWVRTKRDAG